jgi:hypothetical protein
MGPQVAAQVRLRGVRPWKSEGSECIGDLVHLRFRETPQLVHGDWRFAPRHPVATHAAHTGAVVVCQEGQELSTKYRMKAVGTTQIHL